MLFDEIKTGNISNGIFTNNIRVDEISAPNTSVAAYHPHNFLFQMPIPPAIIAIGEMMFVSKNNGSRIPDLDNDFVSSEGDSICKKVNRRNTSPNNIK